MGKVKLLGSEGVDGDFLIAVNWSCDNAADAYRVAEALDEMLLYTGLKDPEKMGGTPLELVIVKKSGGSVKLSVGGYPILEVS